MKKDTRILLIPIIILATALLVLGSVLLSMIIKERRDTSLDTQTLQGMRDKCNNDLYDLRYNLEIADIRDIGREENVVSVYRYTRNGAFEGISIIEFREYTDGTGNIAYIRYNSNSFIIVNGIFENVSLISLAASDFPAQGPPVNTILVICILYLLSWILSFIIIANSPD